MTLKFTGQTDIEASIDAWAPIVAASPFWDDDDARQAALVWTLKLDVWARGEI